MNVAEKYMKQAIKLAGKAAELGEVPIGCVIEYQGKVIGRGYNRRTTDKSTLAHAEIIAIKKACKKILTVKFRSALRTSRGRFLVHCRSLLRQV